MARSCNKQADEILDKNYPVLDKGFVRLVDYMGSDSRIAEAARVSYNSGKTLRDDEGLIDYLFRNAHTSPFEQVVLLFHIKMPIFVARQWVRHRTARMNEISARYSVMKEEFYLPLEEDIKGQDTKNRQASSDKPLSKELSNEVLLSLKKGQESSYKTYNSFLEKGVAREMARINLPLSLYTEVYWQMDLHNLFNFLTLRLSSHAQKEIREYALTIFSICKIVAPVATKAFEKHKLKAKTLSEMEVQTLITIMEENSEKFSNKEEIELLTKLKN